MNCTGPITDWAASEFCFGRAFAFEFVDEHTGLPDPQLIWSLHAESFLEYCHEVDLSACSNRPNSPHL